MDHPHGRGDGQVGATILAFGGGSPPRAWGRLWPYPLERHLRRITPTGVGTAARASASPGSTADHPHGRGDGPRWLRSWSWHSGSPPRAWGRHDEPRVRAPARRITPTGVGTARRQKLGPPSRTDHPHGRGDGGSIMHGVAHCWGSPPRAWGRHEQTPSGGQRHRITPTGVGTARRCRTSAAGGPDHPHGRGDGITSSKISTAPCGSPPRAWGRLRPVQDHRRHRRITPTGVGTALSRSPPVRRFTDHPHGRGDGRCPRR